MYSFPRVNGEPNTVGYTQFFFLPKRLVTEMPRAKGKAITQDLVIDSAFYAGYSVFGELQYNDDPKRTEAGVRYPVKLSGVVPVDKPEYLALFEEMMDDEFIVIVKNNNGKFKICGNQERGLKFIYKTEGVGYRFEFTGEYRTAPPFYYGQFQVDNQVLESEFQPGVAYTVGGFWYFHNTPPSNGVGKNGDGYFNYLTNIVYEKQGNTWVQIGYLGPDQELEEYAYLMTSLAITGNLI